MVYRNLCFVVIVLVVSSAWADGPHVSKQHFNRNNLVTPGATKPTPGPTPTPASTVITNRKNIPSLSNRSPSSYSRKVKAKPAKDSRVLPNDRPNPNVTKVENSPSPGHLIDPRT